MREGGGEDEKGGRGEGEGGGRGEGANPLQQEAMPISGSHTQSCFLG